MLPELIPAPPPGTVSRILPKGGSSTAPSRRPFAATEWSLPVGSGTVLISVPVGVINSEIDDLEAIFQIVLKGLRRNAPS